MTENTENTRINELLNELSQLRAENEELQARNEFLQRMCNGVKLNNHQLTEERNKLCEKCMKQSREIKALSEENFKRIEESNRLFSELMDIKALSMWEFANRYCTDDELEEAGHALARSLGVGQ